MTTNEQLYNLAIEAIERLAEDKSVPKTDLIFILHGLVDDAMDIIREIENSKDKERRFEMATNYKPERGDIIGCISILILVVLAYTIACHTGVC